MRLLNEQYDLQMDDEDIEYRLSQLGGGLCLLLQGKTRLCDRHRRPTHDIGLRFGRMELGLVKPKITVSTRDAYAMVKPKPSEESLLLFVVSRPRNLERHGEERFRGQCLPSLSRNRCHQAHTL